jgi:hypothetical protein
MPAGRELDELVAEQVMGWQTSISWGGSYWIDGFVVEREKVKWNPSTDIAAAWEVVEKMHDSGLKFMVRSHPISSFLKRVVFCTQDQSSSWEVERPEVPEAICRAALLSLIKED